MNLTITMDNPQAQLLEELTQKGITQDSVAITYAFIMAQEGNAADWPKLNAAIRAKWPKGLVRIKQRAWKQIEEWEARVKDGE